MDRVRFGRALGYGARHAAKAVAKAVDAATAPNPSAAQPAASPQRTPARAADPAASAGTQAAGRSWPQPTRSAGARSAGERMAQALASARQGNVHAGHLPGHLRRHIGTPLAKFSSVVWLQVTGTFFALLAAFLSQGLWKERGAATLPIHAPGVGTFYLHAAAFAIFVYFAVSSFVRAHLRQRR